MKRSGKGYFRKVVRLFPKILDTWLKSVEREEKPHTAIAAMKAVPPHPLLLLLTSTALHKCPRKRKSVYQARAGSARSVFFVVRV